MNHFAVQQKLAQHCKSAIVQFEKNWPRIIFNFAEVVAVRMCNFFALVGFSTSVNCIHRRVSGIVSKRVHLLVLLGKIWFDILRLTWTSAESLNSDFYLLGLSLVFCFVFKFYWSIVDWIRFHILLRDVEICKWATRAKTNVMRNPEAVNVCFISPFVEFFCEDGYSPLESHQHKIPGTGRGLGPELTFERGEKCKVRTQKASVRMGVPSSLVVESLNDFHLLVHKNQRQNSPQGEVFSTWYSCLSKMQIRVVTQELEIFPWIPSTSEQPLWSSPSALFPATHPPPPPLELELFITLGMCDRPF